MAWLMTKLVDRVLDTQAGRWLITLALSGCLLVTGYSMVRQYQLGKLNKALQRDNLQYSQQEAVQKAFAEKADQDMKELQKRLDLALVEAKKQQEELAKRQQQLLSRPLTGTCEDMVQQVILDLRE